MIKLIQKLKKLFKPRKKDPYYWPTTKDSKAAIIELGTVVVKKEEK